MTESQKLDLILHEVSDIKTEVKAVKAKIETMETDMKVVKAKTEALEKNMKSVRATLRTHDKKLSAIDKDVKLIKLTIENRIDPSIMRVAEGHLDLSRNFQEAKKPNEEVEMLVVRVNLLEAQMDAIKQKIS